MRAEHTSQESLFKPRAVMVAAVLAAVAMLPATARGEVLVPHATTTHSVDPHLVEEPESASSSVQGPGAAPAPAPAVTLAPETGSASAATAEPNSDSHPNLNPGPNPPTDLRSGLAQWLRVLIGSLTGGAIVLPLDTAIENKFLITGEPGEEEVAESGGGGSDGSPGDSSSGDDGSSSSGDGSSGSDGSSGDGSSGYDGSSGSDGSSGDGSSGYDGSSDDGSSGYDGSGDNGGGNQDGPSSGGSGALENLCTNYINCSDQGGSSEDGSSGEGSDGHGGVMGDGGNEVIEINDTKPPTDTAPQSYCPPASFFCQPLPPPQQTQATQSAPPSALLGKARRWMRHYECSQILGNLKGRMSVHLGFDSTFDRIVNSGDPVLDRYQAEWDEADCAGVVR